MKPGPPDGWVYTARTDHGWREQAACAELEHAEADRILFPIVPHGHNWSRTDVWDEGRALCRSCPVQTECLDWALTVGEPFGMWGGCTAGERAQLTLQLRDTLRLRPRRPPVPAVEDGGTTGACGTEAGYQRHWRANETACLACKRAHAERFHERKQRSA